MRTILSAKLALRALSLWLVFGLFLGLFAPSLTTIPTAQAVSTTVVISEFRTRGPNGGNDEFIELFNLSSNPVNIGGWKINGSNATAGTSTRATITTGTILPAGGYYLLTNSSTSGGPYSGSVSGDQTYATGIADDGGLALLDASNNIIDAVGMSSGSAYKEGTTLTQTTSNVNQSYERKGSPCYQDTDNNANDFKYNNATSNPQNKSTTPTPCNGGSSSTSPSGTGVANPASVSAGSTSLLTVTVTPGTNPTSTGLAVTANLTAIGGVASQQFFDNGTNGDVTAGDNIFSYNATVTANTTSGAKSLPATISDSQSRTASTSISLTVTAATPQPGNLRIHDIQGASHISPYNGQAVSNVPGIVTVKASNGFYLQDPNPDADDRTSEGIFVFTNSAPSVNVGDSVLVSGNISEFRPGCSACSPSDSAYNNLTVTEIASPTIITLSAGNPPPAPIIIGQGGRLPPTQVIENDSASNVENGNTFDPANDGLDFYESLEGMRVQINNPLTVSPTNSFNEIWVLADNGVNASVKTNRGGIVIQPGDFNPERIQIDDSLVGSANWPQVSVGAKLSTVVGVVDYNFGNYEVLPTTTPSVVTPSPITREVATPQGTNELSIATFNVENLDPGDGATKFNNLAAIVVNNLKSPDIVAVEEIQDNNGATNNGTVDASVTYQTLINAITAAGGPIYQYRQINPVDGQDGGEPGGNIRVGFLFNPNRVSFVDRPGGGSTTATTVNNVGGVPQLSASPGRIDPTNTAFNSSRKPLAGEFVFNNQTVFVIANHFNSKGGDQPLEGRFQPPVLSSEVQRRQQATIVRNFVDSILAIDPTAKVAVMGDLNDFQFSAPLNILKCNNANGCASSSLHALIETLPPSEQYTYVFDGNSQAIDHILLTDGLFGKLSYYDVVHVNSEFNDQISDHDPQVAHLNLPVPLTFAPNTLPDGKVGVSYAQEFIAGGGAGSYSFTYQGTLPPGLVLTSGGLLGGTPTTAGTYSFNITVTDAANVTYTLAFTVKIAKGDQTVTLSGVPDNATYNKSFTVTASASTDLAVTLEVSGVCNLNGSTVTITSGTGSCTVTAKQAGNDDYTPASDSKIVTAQKATQTVTLNGVPASASYGDSFTVTASASTSLAVTLEVSGVCNLNGSTVTITSGSGSCTVTAKQAGDNNYNPASSSSIVNAQKAAQTVTLQGVPDSADYGSSFVVSATVSSGLAVTLEVSGNCSLNSSTVTITSGTGTCTVTAKQAGDGNYSPASDTKSITAQKVAPTITWSDPAAITYGTALGDDQLNATASVAGTFVYSPAKGTVLAAGVQTLSVTFTPDDTANYSTATKTVTLTVKKATLTVTANDKTRVYGNANPAFDAAISGFVNGDTAAVVSGNASCSTTATLNSPVGKYPISCTVGTLSAANYTFSFVDGTLTIVKAATKVDLISSNNSTLLNQVVTFTAKVSPTNGSGTPTGSVTFYDGTTTLATVSLVNGTASLTLSTLAAGTHSITAEYSGDTNFDTSISAIFSQKVSYKLCLLYDPNQAKNSGSTVPVQVQLCDVAGKNVSAANIQLKAIDVDGNPALLNDAGNSNPGNFFRFDPNLAGKNQGGYIFNLKTPGNISSGSHNLRFIVNGDTSIIYSAPFTIK